jgi:hypothetical protein
MGNCRNSPRSIWVFDFQEADRRRNMGYHKVEIKRGVLGEISKIQEELDELQDAEGQHVRLLMLCELADLVGAIDHYLRVNFPDWGINDLHHMALLTQEHKEGR